MRQVLSRARALVRRPAVLTIALLLAGGGSALVFLPLFGVPGFELGLALSIAVGLLGGGVGIAAARQERRILKDEAPRPADAVRAETSAGAVSKAMGAALVINVGVLLPPFLVSTLFATLGSQCDPFELVGFYPLLTLPSAMLASVAGVLCGFWRKRAWGAALAYGGLVLLSGVPTAWPIVAGPQVFAFNHFLGHLPGPLYDEAISVRPSLGWFRAETLLWAGLLWLLAGACLDVGEGRLGRPKKPRAGWLALAVLLAVGIGALEWNGPALGLRMTDRYLAEKLGGVRETPHFVLHYWRGKQREDVDRTARDLEFRYAQLAQFLGGAPEGRINVWLYRSEEQKRQLVGAGRTQFAKPWLLALHIDERSFPHSSLHHELAHVMAAPMGPWPFHVTTRAGVWPLMLVIEGFAVAADNRVTGDLTLHQWAAGMRKQGLAPDIRKLLGPEGFYQSAPSRAYTAAGSFLRYLAETYGTEKLRLAYAHADFERVYGRPLDALASEWEQYLDSLPLDAGAVSRAFQRFRQGSLFARTCAREVARLREDAEDSLRSDPQEALTRYQRAASLQPEEPDFQLGIADALEELERPGEAAQVLAALAEKVKEQPSLAAEVALARADNALKQGNTAEARTYFTQVLSLAATPETERTAHVKLAALESPVRQEPVQAYFRPIREELRVILLARALEQAPQDPYLHYLLGRRLHGSGAPALAQEQLTLALQGELPEAIRREALRLLIEEAYLAGDCGAVRHEVGALPDYGEAFKLQASEWVARCEFEETTYSGPLVPRQAFR